MRNVSASNLERFTKEVFKALGIPDHDAGIAARILVLADLRGIESHGVSRLPLYAMRLEKNLVNWNPNIRILEDNGSMIVLDGDHGLGTVVADRAMDICLERAKIHGLAAVTVRNTNHFGITGYYVMKAIDHNMVGFATTNTTPCMAPLGGRKPLLGTNPIAVGIPAGKEYPIVLDMATSIVPHGKLEVAARKGEKIPLGWALDAEGRPTDDPEEAMKGTILPIAGPKGYGLAVLVEVLSGVLAGAAFGGDVTNIMRDIDRPENIGHFFLAFDVQRLIPLVEFQERVDRFIRQLKDSERAEGVKDIFLPGEIEFLKTEERRKNGIPLDDALAQKLVKLAHSVGVEDGIIAEIEPK